MVTLVVFAALLVAGFAITVLARRGTVRDASDLLVGHRRIAGIFVFFLAVGDAYSINVLLGLPGGIAEGGAAYASWYLGYILLAYTVGFFLTPAMWAAGKQWNCQTVADLYHKRFNSKGLGLIAALSGILFSITFAQLMLTGLGVLFSGIGLHISGQWALVISAILGFGYVTIAGLKGTGWVAAFKDLVMLCAILVVGGAVLSSQHGGMSHLFAQFNTPHGSTLLRVPSGAPSTFALTTMAFQPLGFFVIPYMSQFIFGAKSGNTLRKSMTLMPVYMLFYPFVIVSSYYAVAHLGVGSGASANKTFMLLARQLLPDWLLGIVAAGMALAGILVLAVVTLSIGGLLARNVVKTILLPNAPGRAVSWSVRLGTLLSLCVALLFALFYPTLMLDIVNAAYVGFTQFLPGILAILVWKRATKWGVGVGLLGGDITALVLSHLGVTLGGWNPGLVGLGVNVALLVLVSVATKPDQEALEALRVFRNHSRVRSLDDSGKRGASPAPSA